MAAPDLAPNAKPAHRMPMRLHHHAYVVDDQERTRHFYEDILGLPLKATWIENTVFKGETMVFSHTFYGLADGGALAFFNFADPKLNAKMNVGPQKNLCYHIALLVDEETQQAISERCKAEGIASEIIEHGYCKSLYVTDPDGLQVEFTVDPPDVGDINAMQEKIARKSLDAWTSGDTRPNNQMRHHP